MNWGTAKTTTAAVTAMTDISNESKTVVMCRVRVGQSFMCVWLELLFWQRRISMYDMSDLNQVKR